MAQQTFNLGFVQGNYIYWNWTTQAANLVIVRLQDSKQVYIDNATRQSTDPLNPAPLSGGSIMMGDDLSLTIDIPDSNTLIPILSVSNIKGPNPQTGIQIFNIAIEDGTDNDYNDVWFSIVGWSQEG